MDDSQALKQRVERSATSIPTIMFKKASLKIMPLAHNSTTSNSNQDVRPIQGLLSAEKAVLLSRVL